MLRLSIVVLIVTSSTAAFAEEPAAVTKSNTGLRNGFSLSAGQEFGGDREISGTMFGLDWRIGYRVSEPVSVHLHSHLSFGSASELGGNSGATGTFATALMGEYTLPMRVFAGAGVGYGVLNNPSGMLAAARVGYYLFNMDSVGKKRHLNVSLDYRAYFASDGYGTVNQVQFTLGYDRF